MAIGSPQWMYSSGDYELEQSLKFNDDDSAYLSWTPSSASNRRTWTWSGWVKRGNQGAWQMIFSAGVDNFHRTYLAFDNLNKLKFNDYDTNAANFYFTSPSVYRDTGSWYHIIVAVDTTQGTQSNRVKVYVNGEQVSMVLDEGSQTQNHTTFVNNNAIHTLGRASQSSAEHFDGYLGEVNFIDGQQLTPADFGTTGTYGEWKPIKYSGTYGTNGFYLPFKQDYTVEGFSATTYPGNGTTGHTIGGVGFSPDLLWLKERTNTSQHRLFDTVRGASKRLVSDDTSAEATDTSNMTSFNTDGFTLGNSGSVNASGDRYIAWSWDMGGSNATNTNGSITSTVRANTTYGQSIVSFNGSGGTSATIGHGLSSAPEVVIYKSRSQTGNWSFMTTAIDGSYDRLVLNDTSAKTDDSRTAPTTSVITDLGFDSGTATIAYCFHSVTGYSKFGSYTGTGSSGNAITTGFKPAFVMVKRTDSANSWCMYDSLRDDYLLLADASDAEVSVNHLDFTDTGFTIQSTGGGQNASGGTYIYMAFADKREYAYWLDQSGNNNDWTSNNLTESDISVDSPTNNFATMNPLDKDSDITLYEGNTRAYSTNSGGYACTSTISTDSGKWYAEINSLVLPASTRVFGGWALNNYDDSYSALDDFIIHNLGSFQRYVALGSNYDNVSTSFAAGDILQLAWDMDAGKFWFGKNGTWINSGNPTNGTNATVTSSSVDSVRVVYRVSAGAGTTGNLVFNFGQDSSFAGNKTAQGNQDGNDIGDFYYTPPTGFLALCTKNLPDVDVVPSEHFNTVLYTGANPNASQSITGVGFQPDFLWIKSRVTGYGHALQDAVRGSTKRLQSDTTGAESTSTTYVSSFDSDGFSLGIDYGQNAPNEPYVAWNWKANGSGSSNTNGSITSTVSANTDAGFSIVSYTANNTSGATVGHGLSKTPEMIIVKARSMAQGWAVYYGDETDYLQLNLTSATADAENFWNDTAPTSSVFSLGNNWIVNNNSANYIAYCFHSVDGYSKVGSYTGNGSADGTFVYTGFRPAYVMVKRVTSANSYSFWLIYDSARNTYNQVSNKLGANSSLEENNPDYIGTSGANDIDFISNGFKLRASNSGSNSTSDYIYIAFAETPFKYSNAR